MTENLAKYLPLALRVGADCNLASDQLENKITSQDQASDSARDHFLVDEKFALRLDEII
jgi:hypothetical protein